MRSGATCPKYMKELVNPLALSFIYPFLQPINYDLINSLGLLIPLWVGEVKYLFLMPSSQQYLLKTLLSHWSPLSDMSVGGISNPVTIFFHTNFFASMFLMLDNGSASTHFVK